MKPKTIDEIIRNAYETGYEGYFDEDTIKYKQQLIELFMSCVPDKTDENSFDFWNDCRDQMIKNLEKLK